MERDPAPLFEVLFDPLFNPPLPDRPTSRPFPNDRPFDPLAGLPRDEKKCWFCDTFRVVEAAAGRPLAEKLSRLGVMGNLPPVKRAFWNCA